MICSSVCLLRFIVWSFLKARLQFTLDQFNGAMSAAYLNLPNPNDFVPVVMWLLATLRSGGPSSADARPR
jgi:hypothetical protein